MPLDVVVVPELVLVELLLLAAAVPFAVIAALGFWDAPFGRMVKPLPLIFVFFLLMDAGNLVFGGLPRWYFYAMGAPAIWVASYAAVQGALLLTERQEV